MEFTCNHCHKLVSTSPEMSTKNRNHCPHCLWSKHLDDQQAGDRLSTCFGDMAPIGLTTKKVKPDKFGHDKTGEIMLIHTCQTCHKVSLNRIAADDSTQEIMAVFKTSSIHPPIVASIKLLTQTDLPMLQHQLGLL